jgi:hypothetical protein
VLLIGRSDPVRVTGSVNSPAESEVAGSGRGARALVGGGRRHPRWELPRRSGGPRRPNRDGGRDGALRRRAHRSPRGLREVRWRPAFAAAATGIARATIAVSRPTMQLL